MQKMHKRLTQTQMIVLGMFLVILAGTLLLMLPISTRESVVTPPVDALFTAVSASCVTGLVIADTYQHWSVFGQCIILLMIQIGGLGFMTIGVFFAIILRKKIGLWMRGTLQESVNIMQVGGIVRLAKKIIIGTLLFEGIGALILTLHFSQTMEITKAAYYGVFHSVSAFCNAGFDLMGTEEAYVSLTGYAGDWVVNLTIMLLIILGGIGFFVWNDVSVNGLYVRKYKLHTKLTLLTTAALIFGGALILFVMEYHNTLEGLPTDEKILCSLFGSVTARTAGFNTADLTLLSEVGQMLIIMLMLIGGSPGSTAGGMKTTTLAVLVSSALSVFRKKEHTHFFGRQIPDGTIRNAATIFLMYIVLFLFGGMVISRTEDIPLMTALFETASAIGTVGLSLGITPELGLVSHIILICLMFFGRVGGLTLIFATVSEKKPNGSKYPQEKITVG